MKIHLAIVAVLVALGSGQVTAQSVTPNTAQTPTVNVDVYTVKPAQALAFTGTGFEPNEAVDLSLGEQPLTTITADAEGRILHASIGIPFLSAGDYTLSFVGQSSRIPVAVGLKIDGFRPWVVLHNYYVSPQSDVGFSGEDFVPGETLGFGFGAAPGAADRHRPLYRIVGIPDAQSAGVLVAVARAGEHGDIRSQAFRDAHGLGSYRSVDYALEALVERSLIERVGTQQFTVADVFLTLWLRAT